MQDTHYEEAWLDGADKDQPAGDKVEVEKAQLKADVAGEYAAAHTELESQEKAGKA
ncbi:hypothetical protein [Piscinibacter gummiphilus]|uniref:Uncharacterized protein n=1 Tax=Piscinibacter gummiphilus TaxID=946333 RepID=A0ABZ0CTP0_9BURK|nr:hypothetical protein [Piscinibacter gummiphilus]WOB06476.1 hypothetical protein RXV79_16260 [Piscinibacter gummiphilus]